MILAIDFDNTIAETQWPKIIGLTPDAKKYMDKLHEDGHTIIIWTCREGQHLYDALSLLVDNNIKYHYVNDNCPTRTTLYGNNSRKLGADLYLDDKGVAGLMSWEDMYSHVTAYQVALDKGIHLGSKVNYICKDDEVEGIQEGTVSCFYLLDVDELPSNKNTIIRFLVKSDWDASMCTRDYILDSVRFIQEGVESEG